MKDELLGIAHQGMSLSRDELMGAVEKIKEKRILVVGDIMLDRYLWGKVHRISPEAPVPVVDLTKVENRLGGAGLVVRNLVQLGATVNVCGYVGNDEEGNIALELLSQDGANIDLVLQDRTRPTILKTRVIAGTQQLVRIDREEIGYQKMMAQGLAAVVESQLESHDAVIVSDYGKGVITEQILGKLKAGRASGQLGLNTRPVILDPHPLNFKLYNEIGFSVAKPNRLEAEAATGVKIKTTEDALRVAHELQERWHLELSMVTLGEDGLVIYHKDWSEPIFLEAEALSVYDVSGAGDAVTAMFGAVLSTGAGPLAAGYLANVAAGLVVSEVGTVAVDKTKLKRELETHFVI